MVGSARPSDNHEFSITTGGQVVPVVRSTRLAKPNAVCSYLTGRDESIYVSLSETRLDNMISP